MNQEWQPIETGPKNGKSVLLIIPTSKTPIVGYYHNHEGWKVMWDGTPLDGNIFEAPTHWTNLPPPPLTEEDLL